MNVLLNAINDQLTEQGLYIKSGAVSIIDASVIEAKQCRPHKRADGGSTQDPDAAWNVKVGSDGKHKSTYGYKAHINLDEVGLIKAIAYSERKSLFLRKIFPGFLLEKSAKNHATANAFGCHDSSSSARFDPTRGRNIGSK